MSSIDRTNGRCTDPAYYRRHLPHYQPDNATFFVTFRLAGSLPAEVIEKFTIERRRARDRIDGLTNLKVQSDEWHRYNIDYFSRFDRALDLYEEGPMWLRTAEIASRLKDSIHHRDHKEYDLIAYSIMPNHVHMVFSVEQEGRADCSPSIVTRILKSLKWFSALESNRILHRTGPFWQHESYDHLVRGDNDLSRIVEYVLWNPVKAGLTTSWEEWPWSFLKTF